MVTQTRGLIVGFCLAFLAAGTIAVFSIKARGEAKNWATWMIHTQHVLELLAQARLNTSEVSFAITQTPLNSHLDERNINSRLRGLQGQIAELRSLTTDNPQQQERLRQVAKLFPVMLSSLDLGGQSNLSAGALADEKMRLILTDMDITERSLLSERMKRLLSVSKQGSKVLLFGDGFIFVWLSALTSLAVIY